MAVVTESFNPPDSFFQNACRPEGEDGALMLDKMNVGHLKLAEWGFAHLQIKDDADILDIGCGGGANLKVHLAKSSRGTVTGIDYSPVSVEKSRQYNLEDVNSGRCRVIEGNVAGLPFEDNSFDIITAFETVYFWPDIERSLAQVYRVLRRGGTFMICNEDGGETDKGEKWTKIIKGMTIYKPERLRRLLTEAGFTNIEVDTKYPDWLTVTAEKH